MNMLHVHILEILADKEMPVMDLKIAVNRHRHADEKFKNDAFLGILTEMSESGLLTQRDDVIAGTSVQTKFYRRAGECIDLQGLWSVKDEFILVIASSAEEAMIKFNAKENVKVGLDAIRPARAYL